MNSSVEVYGAYRERRLKYKALCDCNNIQLTGFSVYYLVIDRTDHSIDKSLIKLFLFFFRKSNPKNSNKEPENQGDRVLTRVLCKWLIYLEAAPGQNPNSCCQRWKRARKKGNTQQSRRRPETRNRSSYSENNEIEKAYGAQHSCDGSDRATQESFFAIACHHQEADRGSHREGILGAHARGPKSLHLRRMNVL